MRIHLLRLTQSLRRCRYLLRVLLRRNQRLLSTRKISGANLRRNLPEVLLNRTQPRTTQLCKGIRRSKLPLYRRDRCSVVVWSPAATLCCTCRRYIDTELSVFWAGDVRYCAALASGTMMLMVKSPLRGSSLKTDALFGPPAKNLRSVLSRNSTLPLFGHHPASILRRGKTSAPSFRSLITTSPPSSTNACLEPTLRTL